MQNNEDLNDEEDLNSEEDFNGEEYLNDEEDLNQMLDSNEQVSEDTLLEVNDLNENETEDKKRSIIKEILIYALCIVLAFGASRLINIYIIQRTTVDGNSMRETLHDKDVLLVDKLTINFTSPNRFDIIVFQPYEDEKDTFYVKRIIGLPGETVQIIDSQIYINGEVLEEDFGNAKIRDPGRASEEILLGSDEYFVMGDNRNSSLDSRFMDVGNVHEEYILGKAWVRIYPFNDIKILKHK